MKQGKKAFTLVELMIVIAIIGVLVGMLTPMISGAQKRALATTSKTLFSNMVSALERYQTEYGYYPRSSPPATERTSRRKTSPRA